MSVKQQVGSLFEPGLLVRKGEGIEVARLCVVVVDPLPQKFTAVDQVNGQAVVLVLVGKIPPQVLIGPAPMQGLEGTRHQPPRPELLVSKGNVINMKQNA